MLLPYHSGPATHHVYCSHDCKSPSTKCSLCSHCIRPASRILISCAPICSKRNRRMKHSCMSRVIIDARLFQYVPPKVSLSFAIPFKTTSKTISTVFDDTSYGACFGVRFVLYDIRNVPVAPRNNLTKANPSKRNHNVRIVFIGLGRLDDWF